MPSDSTTETAMSPHPDARDARRSLRMVRVLLLGYIASAGIAGLLLVTGGCSSAPTAEDQISEQNDLSTEQEVQNIVSFPFRVAGGVVVYPLKFMFVDLPSSIAEAFEDELARVRVKLASNDPREREDAVAELARSRSPKAVPLLVQALHDSNADLRRDAALALKAFGRDTVAQGEPLLERALRRAGRDDLAGRVSTVESLLIAQLQRDTSPVVRAGCALALGTLGTPATATPALRRAYDMETDAEGSDGFVPSYILLARGQLGDRDAAGEALAHLERAAHPVHIGNALLTLAHLRAPSARAELRRALAHPDERVTIAAITGYGVHEDFGMLISLARDGTRLQQQKALIALGTFGGQAYIGVLEQFRHHPDAALQQAAVFGMAAAGYPRAVPYLVPMLQSLSVVTRLQALTFLVELTGRDLGPEPRPWQNWWNRDGGSFVERHRRG